MIIEIEAYFGDKLIWGKQINESTLRKVTKELLSQVSEEDFTSAFCARFGYTPLPYDDTVTVDYTIDLDTHLVIKPKR